MSCGSDDDVGCPSRAERKAAQRAEIDALMTDFRAHREASDAAIRERDARLALLKERGWMLEKLKAEVADDEAAIVGFREALSNPAPSPEPPALPEGYRLATDWELACVPEKALCRLRVGGNWHPSGNIGNPSCPEHAYVVPITPQPAAASADSKATDTQVGGSHYKGLAIQPAEYCQRNRLPYCEANVVKYVTRHREKNGREDIEKAIHYLQLLLEIEYPKP